MAPGEEFTKEWTFKNTGAYVWPKGVKLVLVAGDQFMTSSEELEEPVPQEGTITISTHFKAPVEPGNFVSYLRLMSEESQFGQRVWVSIVVKEPQPESEV